MLAHTYKDNKHHVAGSFMSEKLDGMRVIYIPWTRGMKKKDVQFANTAKDDRLLEEEICTGLWSRYLNCIHAPDWWLDQLPNVILDGELYSEELPRQDLMSIVKRKRQNEAPASSWDLVHLHAFSLPHTKMLFGKRHVYNQQINVEIDCLEWAESFIPTLSYHPINPLLMTQEAILIPKHATGRAIPHPQEKLPSNEKLAREKVMSELSRITALGGEGMMVRSEFSFWNTIRSHDLIKFKKLQDAEATVIGYTSGKITDKESRNLGRVGALRVKMDNGIEFVISGLKDDERPIPSHEDWADANPDSIYPEDANSEYWPLGTVLTFQYRGKSNDGVPNEARIWRKYDEQ